MDDTSNRNQQIGNICVQWSSLEYILVQIIWLMAGVKEEVGKIMTAHLDMKQRALMAKALAHETNAPYRLKQATKAVVEALYDLDLINRRNQAVHGIHFTIDEPGAVGIEMHRGKGGRAQRVQKDEDLAKLGNQIAEVRNQLFKEATEVIGAMALQLQDDGAAFGAIRDILMKHSLIKSDSEEVGPAQKSD